MSAIDPIENNPVIPGDAIPGDTPSPPDSGHSQTQPWSIQPRARHESFDLMPRYARQETSTASTQGSASTAQTDEAGMRHDAFLHMHTGFTKFQTGATQLDTAKQQFASGKYLGSVHSTLSALGNFLDGGGDVMKGLSGLSTLHESHSWGERFDQAASRLKSGGTPIRAFGDVFKDLDEFIHTYQDPEASVQDVKHAFEGFLGTIARETGENLSTLNESMGAANAFINKLAGALESSGNIQVGALRMRQNLGQFRLALREQNAQAAAATSAGVMAGSYFLVAGLGQVAAEALTSVGYHDLAERLALLSEHTSAYGEKYEALHDRIMAGEPQDR